MAVEPPPQDAGAAADRRVLRDPAGSPYKANWANGWLPAIFQGVEFNSQGMPVHHLEPEIPVHVAQGTTFTAQDFASFFLDPARSTNTLELPPAVQQAHFELVSGCL